MWGFCVPQGYRGRAGKMIRDAKRAAKYLTELQALARNNNEDEFRITAASTSLFHPPELHLHQSVLEKISDKEGWTWTLRGCSEMPFRATLKMFDVLFFAIFERDEAVEYGCPQEVLDAADNS